MNSVVMCNNLTSLAPRADENFRTPGAARQGRTLTNQDSITLRMPAPHRAQTRKGRGDRRFGRAPTTVALVTATFGGDCSRAQHTPRARPVTWGGRATTSQFHVPCDLLLAGGSGPLAERGGPSLVTSILKFEIAPVMHVPASVHSINTENWTAYCLQRARTLGGSLLFGERDFPGLARPASTRSDPTISWGERGASGGGRGRGV